MEQSTWRNLWTNPPPEAAGWTRWWWFGCAVEKDEICYELDEMKQAGLRGVEIQILYPVQEENPEKGNKPIPYFSPEFFEILSFTCEQAKLRGMSADFTLGSGWPYGGPMIPETMGPETLVPYIQEIQGPCLYSFDYTCVLPGQIKRAVLIEKKNGSLCYETAVDVTSQFEPTYIYNWPWGSRLTQIEVPEGDYRLYVFIISNYRQQVAIPARGMNGTVIDHCRKDALDLFFHSMAEPLLNKLGDTAFRAFFCDSIELGGNNFSSLILDEFPKRRGYDFSTALPAVWGDMGEVTPYLRYDYFNTFSELTLENFFERLTELSHEHNMKSRIQAHGTWADILKAYAAADIPEGETFGSHDCYRVNTIHRRLASSAAMVYGKPVVSNESFTWLRMPRFLVTPEMIKRAADAIFCDGMNHIVNHGYAYSPRSEGRPGWAFYASSVISHVNPWWSYYPNVGHYIQRVSALMQTSQPVSNVAVYVPQADIWSDAPASELHMSLNVEKYVGEDTVNALQKAGYWFTYVNDDAVRNRSDITAQGMKIGENTYRAVILSGCTRMPVETAEKLNEFVRSGGLLITVGRVPDDSCGYVNFRENRETVRELMQGMFGYTGANGMSDTNGSSDAYGSSDANGSLDAYGANEANGVKTAEYGWKECGRGFCAVAPDGTNGLRTLLGQRLAPDFCAGENSEDVGFIHRRYEGADIYFVSNMGTKERAGACQFAAAGSGISVINAVTSEEKTIRGIKRKENGTELTMSLAPNESCLVVFDGSGTEPGICEPEKWEEYSAELIWELSIPEKNLCLQLDEVKTWEQIEELRHYSGEGIYTARFDLKDIPEQDLQLDFGEIDCAARVSLNGEPAGELWMAPYRLRISPERLCRGENVLTVCVSGTLINEVLDENREEPDIEETVIDGWPYWSSIINNVRQKRVYWSSERSKAGGPRPIGIAGPVKVWNKSGSKLLMDAVSQTSL